MDIDKELDQELKKELEKDNPLKRDEAYYENLYNDLPKEVVDILLKTHPLRSGQAPVEDVNKMRYPRRERNASRKQNRPERIKREEEEKIAPEPVEEVFREPVPSAQLQEQPAVEPEEETPVLPESDPVLTPEAASEPSRQTPEEPEEQSDPAAESIEPVRESIRTREAGHSREDDEEEDDGQSELAQMVRKKGLKREAVPTKVITDTITKNFEKLQQTVQEARRAATEEVSEKDLKEIEDLSREEAMQAFFKQGREDDEDDYDYEERHGAPSPMTILLVIFIIAAAFFGYRSFSLSAKLSKAQANASELESLRTTNEQLKMDKLSLEDQLAAYQTGSGENTATPGESTGEAEQTPTQTQGTTYTVEAGDTPGSIAKKFYGDFSKYPVILEANGLSESSTLSIGQTLTIPAQ